MVDDGRHIAFWRATVSGGKLRFVGLIIVFVGDFIPDEIYCAI